MMIETHNNSNEKMFRVLFIIKNSALNRKMNTGIENLAWGLAEKGMAIYIVSGGSKPKDHNYKFSKNVKYFFVDKDGENPINLVRQSVKVIEKYNINIVVGWIKNISTIASVFYNNKIIYIANQGEIAPSSIVYSIFRTMMKRKIGFLDGLILIKNIKKFSKRADKIISISKAVRDSSIKTYNLNINKCLVIPRGIDISIYKKHINKIENNYEKKRLMFAGNIQSSKGIDDLVESLKFVRSPLKLTLCGKVDTTYLEIIKNKVITVNNNSNTNHEIEYLGLLGQKELVMEYNECDFFIFPSHSEGLGKVLIEAMACGAPVICSDIDTFKEIVKDKYNGLMFEVKSSKSLAKAINIYLNDMKMSNLYAENARKTVVEKFSKEFEVDMWQKVIRDEIEVKQMREAKNEHY